jgi:RNA polymerase sigma factor (sigma-70 family)
MGKNYKVTDEELVSQICKANDAVLFGVLYERYENAVFNKCYGFVHSRDEAKDLTHDIFLHIFVKLHCFSGESRFSTWLYSVTSNYGINYLNRNKERKISSNSKPIKEEFYLATEINDYSLSQLQLDRLEIALTKIKPEESMILKLKYQDGASVKTLQEVLGLSESAVKMRVLRAKSKIIEAYNSCQLQ